jgi:predicted GNAT family acetyltransferase
MKIHHSVAASVVALAMAGCAQIAVVSEKRPAPLPPGSSADRVATQTINGALGEEKKQPIVALGAFVAAARDTLRQLDRNPSDAEARRAYNFAVARIFTVVRDAKLDPWTHPMRVGANGEFTLTWKRDPRPEWNLALYDLIPTDELDFKGTYVKDHVTKEGIGAPLVAKRELTAQQASAFFTPPYIYYSVTATAQFEGSRCVISINDPLAAESVRVDGHTYPLAADFTASYAITSFGSTATPAAIPIHTRQLSYGRSLTPSKRNFRSANQWWLSAIAWVDASRERLSPTPGQNSGPRPSAIPPPKHRCRPTLNAFSSRRSSSNIEEK